MSISKTTNIVGFWPVLTAMAGNFLIFILKLIGFLLSGSSALFSEAIHSLADTMNQSLLMVGLKKSRRQADDDHAYGYGQERFIWALISAMGIFFIGAGVTVYHGLASLYNAQHIEIEPYVYVILACSFIVESITLYIALRDVKKNNPDLTLAEVLEQGDPTTLAVVYEDTVAVIGVVVAFISILMTSITGYFFWDAIGSVVIGLMLGVVAVILVNKNRQYLIKKSVSDDLIEDIMDLLNSEPAIEKVIDLKSVVHDIGNYQIKFEIEFNGTSLMKELYKNTSMRDEYDAIQEEGYEEFVRFCSDYADRIPRLMGRITDDIERRIQKKYPFVKYIDIEIN